MPAMPRAHEERRAASDKRAAAQGRSCRAMTAGLARVKP